MMPQLRPAVQHSNSSVTRWLRDAAALQITHLMKPIDTSASAHGSHFREAASDPPGENV